MHCHVDPTLKPNMGLVDVSRIGVVYHKKQSTLVVLMRDFKRH